LLGAENGREKARQRERRNQPLYGSGLLCLPASSPPPPPPPISPSRLSVAARFWRRGNNPTGGAEHSVPPTDPGSRRSPASSEGKPLVSSAARLQRLRDPPDPDPRYNVATSDVESGGDSINTENELYDHKSNRSARDGPYRSAHTSFRTYFIFLDRAYEWACPGFVRRRAGAGCEDSEPERAPLGREGEAAPRLTAPVVSAAGGAADKEPRARLRSLSLRRSIHAKRGGGGERRREREKWKG